MEWRNQVIEGDALTMLGEIPDKSCQMSVSSPPYWGLRDYQIPPTLWPAIDYAPMPGLPLVSIPEVECCLGLESDPWVFVGHIVQVYREIWRVLRDDGTCWVNFGDSYCANRGNTKDKPGFDNKAAAGHASLANCDLKKGGNGIKEKDLIGIPWRVAFALQSDGWYLRSDIIWSKPNPMPESVTDRPTKAHEYLFLLSKSEKYFYDCNAVREKHNERTRRAATFRNGGDYTGGNSFNNSQHKKKDSHGDGEPSIGRNRRSVWTIPTFPLSEAHFATFPPKLIEPCILAGSRPGDVILDSFMGARTTAITAHKLGRDFTGCEISQEYNRIGTERYRRECCQRNAFAELARKKTH